MQTAKHPTLSRALPAAHLNFGLSQLAIDKTDENGAVHEKLTVFSIKD
jgi:hypothetical protein